MNTITTGICEIKVTPDEDSAVVEVSHYGITDVEFHLDPQQREELALMLAPHYGRLQARIDELERMYNPTPADIHDDSKLDEVLEAFWTAEDDEDPIYDES